MIKKKISYTDGKVTHRLIFDTAHVRKLDMQRKAIEDQLNDPEFIKEFGKAEVVYHDDIEHAQIAHHEIEDAECGRDGTMSGTHWQLDAFTEYAKSKVGKRIQDR